MENNTEPKIDLPSLSRAFLAVEDIIWKGFPHPLPLEARLAFHCLQESQIYATEAWNKQKTGQ